jgi:hypothetical protein
MLTCKIKKDEEWQPTDNNIIYYVSHSGDDRLEDIKEGAEKADNNNEW